MRISDWSSDVCSSDLRSHHTAPHLDITRIPVGARTAIARQNDAIGQAWRQFSENTLGVDRICLGVRPFGKHLLPVVIPTLDGLAPAKIGRASCRERVCQNV